MPRRVERTRAGGTWTEAKYWGYIRGALRQAFLRYPVRGAAKRRQARRVGGRHSKYECEGCGELFDSKDVQVDHIVACGTLRAYDDLPGFVQRLFCEADGLQVLCTTCHQTKTKQDNKTTRSKRK
jgi:5-methylcytosine-specific restriction endonuclease McrA